MNQFDFIQRTYPNGYFDALEYAFKTIENIRSISSVFIYGANNQKYEFFINDDRQGRGRALIKNCILLNGMY